MNLLAIRSSDDSRRYKRNRNCHEKDGERKKICGIGAKDTFILKPSLLCCLIVTGQLIAKKKKVFVSLREDLALPWCPLAARFYEQPVLAAAI